MKRRGPSKRKLMEIIRAYERMWCDRCQRRIGQHPSLSVSVAYDIAGLKTPS